MQEHVEYDRDPSVFRGILRALVLPRRPLDRPESMPSLSATRRGIRNEASLLRQYRNLCALPGGNALPVLFPSMRATVIHLDMVSHPQFPFAPAGLLHLRQQVSMRRGIAETEVLDLSCRVVAARAVAAGLEIDVSAFFSSGAEAVCECLSTYLKPGKFGEAAPGSSAKIPPLERPNPALQAVFEVPSNIGKHYARISRDYNPIHLSPLTARYFGFRQPITHGLWTAERCLAALPALPKPFPVRAEIVFKGPVFVGNRATMRVEPLSDGYAFDLYCGDNPRPCLLGRLVMTA